MTFLMNSRTRARVVASGDPSKIAPISRSKVAAAVRPFIVPPSSASVTFGARGIGSPSLRPSRYRSVICLLGSLPSLPCPRLAKRMADKLAGNGAISTNSRAAAPNCAPPLRHATMIARSVGCRSRSANPNSPDRLITSSKFSLTSIAITMH